MVGQRDDLLDAGVPDLLRVLIAPRLRTAWRRGRGKSKPVESVRVLLALDEEDAPLLR